MSEATSQPTTGAETIVWDLSIFYSGPEDPAIEADMAAIDADIAAFAGDYRGVVASLDAAGLLAAMERIEALLDRVYRLEMFAQMLYVTDTNNPTFGALMQKLTEYAARVQQGLLFFELEWTALDDDGAAATLAQSELAHFRHYLEAERRYKPHLLSEPEEKLLVEKAVTGREAWNRFFSQLMGAARYELRGEELTQSEVLSKLFDTDRELRREAAEAVTAGLQDQAMQLTYVFNVLAADKASEDRQRAYDTWVSSRNLSNKVADDVVEALVEAVTANYDIVAEHYELKRRLLGYDELLHYDRNSPLPVPDSDRIYPWEEARDIVQQAYQAFSPRMAEISQRFFDEGWIHAALAPGKMGGAFSASGPVSAHPFIMMNYTGRERDVSTLAHELGHGVHQVLATETQGLLNAQTPLTTAEMASTFGEMLVFNDLMEREPDAEARLAMLAAKIEDSFGTIFRQVAMNRFEHGYHNARRETGELSAEQLGEIWLETQRDMFQGSVNIGEDYGHWWSYVPHFLNVPGYVYAYAFGELLVLALFRLYQQRGADFVPDYLDVLAAGGSDWPHNILARLGVDLTDPEFWNEGLAILRDMVRLEEQLAREVYPEKFSA
ncbi:MAG: M3 family oligoendopeptidase [Anaerolineaceae bacterium]|nr:M3 family oligoendopeptidase [Anaerolineaceae bacterium]